MDKIPVVIVDDDEEDRYIARRCLTRAPGFDPILEASAGNELLEKFFNGHPPIDDEGKPLLVLLDINMPGIDGFETARQLTQRMEAGKGPKSVIVMIYTSSSNPLDLAEASKLHAVKGYIVKPLTNESLPTILAAYNT